jgi:hypothetical protein
LGKVLSFFGVMLLVFGLLQGGADAAGNGKGKGSSAPGLVKKLAQAAADVASSPASENDDCGEYCSTTDGTPSANGNGGGNGNQPCAGCVGNADNENPSGQHSNGSDSNNGYECDGNNGVAKGNPAHSVCHEPTTTTQPPQTTTTVQQTTTTVAQQTTTTAPLTTTTTAAGATTTTVAIEGATTTTAEVLGVQFNRGDEQARGLATTGVAFFRPFTMLGALLLLVGITLMTIKLSPAAKG